LPALAAYSHSASVSRRYALPVIRLSHPTYPLASPQLTKITGRSPRSHALSETLGHAPAATQMSHSTNVTAVLLTATSAALMNSWCRSVGSAAYSPRRGADHARQHASHQSHHPHCRDAPATCH